MSDLACMTLNGDTDLISVLENWLEVKESVEPSNVKVQII